MIFFAQQFVVGQMIWGLLFFVFILLYPKFMMYKMVAEIEAVAVTMEGYVKKATELITTVSEEKGTGGGDPLPTINRIMEFFVIPPVDLDPYGILARVEHLLDKSEDRLEAAADEIAPGADRVWRGNTISLLKGGIGLNMMAKIMRHYVEFVKKTKNLQIAMMIHMSLPLIKKVAKAQMKGVETIGEGKPIGDSIGPMVAATLITGEVSPAAKDVVRAEVEIAGRRVHVIKADGPGATLGKLGDAVKKIADERPISKIITVDASLKLEGEQTGKVAEGIGAAIGDPGPEKAKMEEAAVSRNIPLEAYAVKMSIEEAISPLCSEIADSVGTAVGYITESVGKTPGGEVLLVGVGNTCGIGNTKRDVDGMVFPKKEEEKEDESLSDKVIKFLVQPPRPERFFRGYRWR